VASQLPFTERWFRRLRPDLNSHDLYLASAPEPHRSGLDNAQVWRAFVSANARQGLKEPLVRWVYNKLLGITVRGLFTPIVSEELFEEVERGFVGSGTLERQTRSLRSHEFPLANFAYCAACGKGMAGSFNTSRSGKPYPYYFCRTSNCRAAKFRRDDLHRMFYEVLYGLFPNTEIMPLFCEVVADVWKQKNQLREEIQAQTEVRISALKLKKQKLIDLVASEVLSPEDFKDQLEQVGTALKNLESQLLPAATSEKELAHFIEFAEWMSDRIAGIWNSATLTNKVRLHRVFFPKGISVSANGFGTVPDPLFFGGWQWGPDSKASMASPEGFEPSLPP
jgi:hypothetical protein